MAKYSLFLAVGVFFGCWLLIPLIFQVRTQAEGFLIGVISIPIVLAFCKIFSKK
jgi:hypothetical protein